MPHRGLTLESALAKVKSTKTVDRDQGLQDLKSVLDRSNVTPDIVKLKDKHLLPIFEDLFRAVSLERSHYIKGSKIRSVTESRLTCFAEAVLLLVTGFVTRLRNRTLLPIILHLTNSLSDDDGSLVTPLANAYLKSLSTVLGYGPHVEHLNQDEWMQAVDFCCASLRVLVNDADVPNGASETRSFLEQSTAQSSISRTGSQQQGAKALTRNNHAQYLTQCLVSLASGSNSPLLDRSAAIVDTLLSFLEATHAVPIAIDAFRAINSCLSRQRLHSTSKIVSLVPRLFAAIRTFWTRNQDGPRDAMLCTLVICFPFVEYAFHSDADDNIFDTFDSLLEVLRIDYITNDNRGSKHLRLDELRLDALKRMPREVAPLQNASFGLRSHTETAEHNWTLLNIIVVYSALFDAISAERHPEPEPDPNDSPRPHKRLRRTSKVTDFASDTAQSSNSKKQYAMHILAFAASSIVLSEVQLLDFLECLEVAVSDADAIIVSWALLALSGCALQPSATLESFKLHWTAAGGLALRLLGSLPHCRPASHLASIMLQRGLLESHDLPSAAADIARSASQVMPAAISDAACAWMAFLLSRLSTDATVAAVTRLAGSICSWLRTKWTPSNFATWSYAATLYHHVSLLDLFDLLRMLCQSATKHDSMQFPSLNDVGRTVLEQDRVSELLAYVMARSSARSFVPLTCQITDSQANVFLLSASAKKALESQLIEHVNDEIQKALAAWDEMLKSSVRSLTVEAFYMVFSLACVSDTLTTASDQVASPRLHACREATAQLVNALSVFLSSAEGGKTFSSAVLEALGCVLPGASSLQSASQSMNATVLSQSTLRMLSRALVLPSEAADIVDEDEDFDEDFDVPKATSQNDLSQPNSILSTRDFLSYSSSPRSFDVCCATYITYLRDITSGPQEESPLSITASFIDHLLEMPPDAFISTRPLMSLLETADCPMSLEDAERLLLHVAEDILPDYVYSYSEAAIRSSLHVLKMTMHFWSEGISKDIANIAFQVYEWLSKLHLDNHRLSPAAQIELADFLSALLRVDPDFGTKQGQPPLRKVLLSILSDSDISVKFFLSDKVPRLFEMYTLNTHHKILESVLDSLPFQTEWTEGIALRLQTFQVLAQAWSTLLRSCVFRIVETVGNVSRSAGHATLCLAHVAEALKLRSSEQLFTMFRATLLVHWMNNGNDVLNFPHAIFGFQSKSAFYQTISSDLVPVLAPSGHLQEIADVVGSTPRELCLRHFPQCLAYALGADIDASVSTKANSHDHELRLRDIVGDQEQMNNLAAELFPSILADLFVKLDSEDAIKKALDRRKGYENAASLYQSLQRGDPEGEYLPPNLQPAFKAQIFLIDAIERLCRRVGRSSSAKSTWSPSTVSLIARRILDAVHPALGPLQARRTVRKLRVLVVLGGNACYRGYVLEQLLFAVRPLVSDIYCSQEAATLFQHILEQGAEHLKHRAGFVLGTCLATNLELSRLVNAKQDSATQDSSFRTAISRADELRGWLSKWSAGYETILPSAPPLARHYSTMMLLSRDKMHEGSSSRESAEGRLLQGLLHDMQSSRRILSSNMTELCFRLLTGNNFKAASLPGEDILGGADIASRLAPSLWKLCTGRDLPDALASWSAKAFGRSYLHNGQVPPNIASETDLSQAKELSVVQTDIVSSFAAILRTLAQLLDDQDAELVSLSENTLRAILQSTKYMDERDMMQQCLDSDIGQVLFLENQAMRFGGPEVEPRHVDVRQTFQAFETYQPPEWIQDLTLGMIEFGPSVALVEKLLPALQISKTLCGKVFPYVLHTLLYFERQQGVSGFSNIISEGFNFCLNHATKKVSAHIAILINGLVYLRTRVVPGEQTKFDRNRWLKIDLQQASRAACICNMFKSALMFAEIDYSLESEPIGRRSSRPATKTVPDQLLLSIFRDIDEPDAFHGVPQVPSIDTVIDRLAFEGREPQELLLRGARADGMLRAGTAEADLALADMIGTLTTLNMSSLALRLSSGDRTTTESQNKSMAQAAIKLQQWDIPVVETRNSGPVALLTALQNINFSSSIESMRVAVDERARKVFQQMAVNRFAIKALKPSFSTLAALVDLDESISIKSTNDLIDIMSRFEQRNDWMTTSPSEDFSGILLAREAFFGILSRNKTLQGLLCLGPRESKLAEAKASLIACRVHRENGSMQDALSKVAYLVGCADQCANVGLRVSAAVQLETSHVLWAQGELIASIRMLKDMQHQADMGLQDVPVSQPALLAILGDHVSEARLEKPEDIMRNYLTEAVQKLRAPGSDRGDDAGRVYHAFAPYCHNQLANDDNTAELRRSDEARDKRISEIRELESILKHTKLDEREKARVKSDRTKAKKWYDIDAKESERLRRIQEQFLRQSLDAYLHSLGASDEHDTDVLRFLSLWLEHASNDAANASVHRVAHVPSLKFAPLMNQLASRLQDTTDKFQSTMTQLVERICHEHPYHGMYHIYAGSRTTGGNDRVAISRNQAATKLASRLASAKDSAQLWDAIQKANGRYMNLANARSESFKSGVRLELRKISAGRALENDIPGLNVPPLTMNIALRADCDYSQVPCVESFRREMNIAGGLSAPKIVTAVASDGSHCKQLFKAGADDLRQDAIMEQVFEQVSALLHAQNETRRRHLQIRTYKVVPLDAQSGAIEFVQNTQPLNDFLRAAHQRYYPKDLKWESCRSKIDEVRQAPTAKRIEVYRQVAQGFHPVLRHFFFERFEDPDEWFAKRLAYTRSTAAISILGHALGLGDRHCQNILLDTNSGEMVHIDLGVAFEAGRILSVPEVVPFRLTRDVVDGFGIMGVEGVFRRCSEFTLEALRSSRDAIMTLLNVLRYDPLYSWSMSPLRAQRLQNEQAQEEAGNGREVKSFVDDGGEADRALSVVERKLAPGLSAQATVNELIQQATDERNLALLFCGWAAFA